MSSTQFLTTKSVIPNHRAPNEKRSKLAKRLAQILGKHEWISVMTGFGIIHNGSRTEAINYMSKEGWTFERFQCLIISFGNTGVIAELDKLYKDEDILDYEDVISGKVTPGEKSVTGIVFPTGTPFQGKVDELQTATEQMIALLLQIAGTQVPTKEELEKIGFTGVGGKPAITPEAFQAIVAVLHQKITMAVMTAETQNANLVELLKKQDEEVSRRRTMQTATQDSSNEELLMKLLGSP